MTDQISDPLPEDKEQEIEPWRIGFRNLNQQIEALKADLTALMTHEHSQPQQPEPEPESSLEVEPEPSPLLQKPVPQKSRQEKRRHRIW